MPPLHDHILTPRDYTQPIDFHELSLSNTNFADCLRSNGGKVDFKNPEHQRALTKALLLTDFNLHLFLPSNRLCPALPIRYLYVQWLSALLASTSPTLGLPTRESPSTPTSTGLDIGVGASCIYPLLLAASHTDMHIYGTELDGTNHEYAVHNIAANDLGARITLLRSADAEDALIPLDRLGVQRLGFTMCNPPFYGSVEEARRTFSKATMPRGECTGAEVEMVTPGGEVGYISRMISESLELRDRVRWYTVQVGRWVSVGQVVGRIRESGCVNYAVHVLQPAGQTVRWVVGWSWSGERACDAVARHASLVGKGVLPEPGESVVAAGFGWDMRVFVVEMVHALARTRVQARADGVVIVLVDSAVWSRQERRRRARDGGESSVQEEDTDDLARRREVQDFGYAFAVSVRGEAKGGHDELAWSCTVRWMKGENRTVFESFCGMLQRKLREQDHVRRLRLEEKSAAAME